MNLFYELFKKQFSDLSEEQLIQLSEYAIQHHSIEDGNTSSITVDSFSLAIFTLKKYLIAGGKFDLISECRVIRNLKFKLENDWLEHLHLVEGDIKFSMIQESVDEFLRLNRTLKIRVLFRSLRPFDTSTHTQLLYSHEYE